ncbi:SIR2 family NAD-dependent protein deacylase [Aromatoleum sp.]|uniref:SIR2 family NAD-dependent protein deacylase n=1 Tax=Aromatoleum sp. TaxID=2307007 RepID=UPI002FC86726
MHSAPILRAAKLLTSADGLLITAGAGMGVDSGLPDFRGNEGFWKAYPALAHASIDFQAIANPAAFDANPKRAWGFYGHRLALYRKSVPHSGFRLLLTMARRLPRGAFVVTSNVDGQFQKAGFAEERILEIHGSIHHLQCCGPCRETVWSANSIEPETDDERCEWSARALPRCVHCGGLARPNILMFDDLGWIDSRTEKQREHFDAWVQNVASPVVIELGAGVDLPAIRWIAERSGWPLIRINPRHPQTRSNIAVSVPVGARQALELITKSLADIQDAL